MSFRVETDLVLLQNALSSLNLNSNAADDAQPEEEFTAEALCNAVREIDATILEDCESRQTTPAIGTTIETSSAPSKSSMGAA